VSLPSAERLGHHLRQFDREAFTAFVADLWAARGFETRRDGDVVVVTREGEAPIRLLPAVSRPWVRIGGRRTPPTTDRAREAAVDVVVTAGRRDRRDSLGTGHRVVDATGLREMLAYAVDRSTADELCRRHLDAPFDSLPPSARERGRAHLERIGGAVAAAGQRVPALPAATGPAVAVVALLLVVGLVGAGAGVTPGTLAAGTGTDGGDRPVDGGEEPDAGGDDGADDGDAVATDADDDDEGPSQLGPPGTGQVPGLSREGIENVTELARAHERGLANRSYTMWLDYYGPRNGSTPNVRIQEDIDIAVEGDRYTLVASVETNGSRTRTQSAYHDGRDWYVADYEGDNASYRRVSAQNPLMAPLDPEDVQETVVERYLDTSATAVTGLVTSGQQTFYRVVATGDPSGFVPRTQERYEAVAFVDSEGVVYDLTVEYTRPFGDQTVSIRVEVTLGRLDATTVTPPAWYDREFGGNATTDTAATASGIDTEPARVAGPPPD
jgi:hypothetical protein